MTRKANRGTWVLIDATEREGDIGPSSLLAGVPLVSRHVRQAARSGWAGAVVVAGGTMAEVRDAFARRPPPAGFPVELVPSWEHVPGDRTGVRLRCLAIYRPEALDAVEDGETPVPAWPRLGPKELRAAEAELYGRLRKSAAEDGIFAWALMRPLSVAMTRTIVNSQVTPNQITGLVALCGGSAAWLAGRGGAKRGQAAGLLFWAGAVLDGVDGNLARLRLEESRLGQWIDTLTDDLSTYGILAALGIGLRSEGSTPAWAPVAMAAGFAGMAGECKIYAELRRLGLPMDSSQYPWFFGRASGPAPTTAVARGFHGASFLFRRDATATFIGLLCLLKRRRLLTGLMVFGTAAYLGTIGLDVARKGRPVS